MKPRTKIEKEVVRLSNLLPELSDRLKKRAEVLIDYSQAVRYRGRKTHIIHFIVVTTKGNWQVLRHFYLYARFRYKKLQHKYFFEVMQQWFKDGKYVFMCRNRCMGYINDNWTEAPISIKKNYYYTSILTDPRNIGYDKVIYNRVKKEFSYLPKDTCYRIDNMYRAVNVSPFWETVIKKDIELYNWCLKGGLTYDKQKTTAVKIALRHNYDFKKVEWKDLVDMLIYLGKDIHNPQFVCPENLMEVHNKISEECKRKRTKLIVKRHEIEKNKREKELLRRMQQEEEAKKNYAKRLKRFLGIVITGDNISIRPLQSVEEFKEEGDVMHHCVFSNAYYDTKKHPNALILTAQKGKERLETVEVDISDFHIVQSRGKYNQNTKYHDKIISLVNNNMDVIRNCSKRHG